MAIPTILDCTLRDGGYYTAWHFAPDLVADYLAAMGAAGVTLVEIGQRFARPAPGIGPHGRTDEPFLASLPVPPGVTLAVMVNAGDLAGDTEGALRELFPFPAGQSRVDLVRIACHLRELAAGAEAARWLAPRGYRIALNMMQAAALDEADLAGAVATIGDAPIAAVYLADSTGSLDPARTRERFGWLHAHWRGASGFHAHDNRGMALANTLAARDAGATWLDATVAGMGRGPGNCATEALLPALGHDGAAVAALAGKHFAPLKARHGWGANRFYRLAGEQMIHPTYIQEMLADPRYDEADILAVIARLAGEGARAFSAETLDRARGFYQGAPEGAWRPADLLAGRDLLLLGSGPGAAAAAPALAEYIARAGPVVAALNLQAPVAERLIDLRIACHPVRLLADAPALAARPQPLVAPFAMLPADAAAALTATAERRDFGIAIGEEFAFARTHCTLPRPFAALYALGMAASGGARRVLLAGFDGYGAGDVRQVEMAELLTRFQEAPGAPPLLAVTPTSYPLPQTPLAEV